MFLCRGRHPCLPWVGVKEKGGHGGPPLQGVTRRVTRAYLHVLLPALPLHFTEQHSESRVQLAPLAKQPPPGGGGGAVGVTDWQLDSALKQAEEVPAAATL